MQIAIAACRQCDERALRNSLNPKPQRGYSRRRLWLRIAVVDRLLAVSGAAQLEDRRGQAQGRQQADRDGVDHAAPHREARAARLCDRDGRRPDGRAGTYAEYSLVSTSCPTAGCTQSCVVLLREWTAQAGTC